MFHHIQLGNWNALKFSLLEKKSDKMLGELRDDLIIFFFIGYMYPKRLAGKKEKLSNRRATHPTSYYLYFTLACLVGVVVLYHLVMRSK